MVTPPGIDLDFEASFACVVPALFHITSGLTSVEDKPGQTVIDITRTEEAHIEICELAIVPTPPQTLMTLPMVTLVALTAAVVSNRKVCLRFKTVSS